MQRRPVVLRPGRNLFCVCTTLTLGDKWRRTCFVAPVAPSGTRKTHITPPAVPVRFLYTIAIVHVRVPSPRASDQQTPEPPGVPESETRLQCRSFRRHLAPQLK